MKHEKFWIGNFYSSENLDYGVFEAWYWRVFWTNLLPSSSGWTLETETASGVEILLICNSREDHNANVSLDRGISFMEPFCILLITYLATLYNCYVTSDIFNAGEVFTTWNYAEKQITELAMQASSKRRRSLKQGWLWSSCVNVCLTR